MAEIKSTMEMVLERAARMAASAGDGDNSEEKGREGMRLAAAYLRGESEGIAAGLAACPPADQPAFCRGLVEGLLRNIFLAREAEKLEVADKAMNGLVAIGQGKGELLEILGEMKKILDGYGQHREQLKKQLEAQFVQQIEMMEKTLAKQTGFAMKLQPAQHPKFQEEWRRIESQLDEQYGRALTQMKQMVEENLNGAA